MLMFVESIVNLVILILILMIILRLFMPVLLYFQSLLRCFMKKDVQVDVSPVKLVRFAVTDQKLWVSKASGRWRGSHSCPQVTFIILEDFSNVLHPLQSHLTSEVFMLKN